MKILYISKSIIPSRTANSIHVMKMCQALSDNGHEVVLLAPAQKKEYEKKIINVYEYYGVKNNFLIKRIWHPNYKGGIFFYILGIFFYLIKNKNFNIIYGRFLHGCYVASLLKNKVIFESHESIQNMKIHRIMILKKLIENKYFKKLIVISKELKNIYQESGILSADKIQIAHDGADEVLNFNTKIDLLGGKNCLKVGYVGHLYKGRGIELIIECAKKINDVTFHIVGGIDEDIEKWKNYVKKLGLLNIYFYGFVPPKETIYYRNSFDVVLAPYEKQVSVFGNSGDTSKFMSPLKIFEYMSSKKAIIASDLPVLREILNSKNAILVEPGNINDLVNAVYLLKKKDIRERIANHAFIDFKKYSWKNRALEVI